MDKSNIKIGENDIKPTDMDRVNHLLKQLSPSSPALDFSSIDEAMRTGIILTLRDASQDDILVGMGMLIPVQKLFYLRGDIEEIVVDQAYRGLGLGRQIVTSLVEKSQDMGMKYVALTSSPNRVEANGLYRSIGFGIPETNLYRLYNK